jgi:hypothetical protein
MFAGHPILHRGLIWFTISGPVFGLACALLAKEWGRRQWVWFLLGFFFTFNAVLALIFLKTWEKRLPGNKSPINPDTTK